jgi:hypothetical protein
MAEPTITTSYAGEYAGKYISASLLSAPTIENGGITVLPNIKFKEVLQVVSTDNLLSNATCDFNTAGNPEVTLTEKVLQVEDFQVNSEICKSQFHNTWQSQEMGFSAFDELPKSFSDYILGYYASKVAAKVESNIWEGVNANPGEFDGLVTLALADATVNDVTATPITALNVIDEMGKIIDAIPTTVYGSEDLTLFVSSNMARAYIRALGGFAAAGLGANGTDAKGTQWYTNGALSFDGIPVFVANGLNDNTAMAAQKSNLYFGCSLLSDTQEVRLIDMSPIDGSQNCRIIMRMSMGVQIGIGADVVLYHV